MHKADLMLGLSLSLVERRERGKVVNQWSPFQDLYKELKHMTKWVFGKKNKRYDHYVKTLDQGNHRVFYVDLPNDTRVAGAWNLMKGTLRSRWSLAYYAEQHAAFSPNLLSDGQFRQLAQFEAIISEVGKFCFTSQSDRIEAAGELLIELVRLKAHYEHNTIYKVVDVNSRKQWSATTPFVELPTVELSSTEAVGMK